VAELMLLSNSFSPGLGVLEHALPTIAELLPGGGSALFIPFAGSDPDTYTDAMHDVLGPLDIRVAGAHRVADPHTALADCDLVFVGGGNTFRLLRAVERHGLLPAIRRRVRTGLPYIGVSAGANLACPTLRTTNDMPITQPVSFEALNLIAFQLNPHYPDPNTAHPHLVAARDARLREFLEDNDVPVVGLCEGSWLRVHGVIATIGGTTGGRLFRRGALPLDLQPGDDVSALLTTDPKYDTPIH
jgi:dipeptidase E